MNRPPDRGGRGSVSIEVAVLTPVFLLLVALATVAGRTAIAQNAIEVAAHDTARAASISRTEGQARDQVERARADLHSQGYDCAVVPDLQDFGDPIGPPADPNDPPVVTVNITCTVSFVDLPIRGVLDETRIRASFTSPLDWYRSRSVALGGEN